MLLWNPGPTMRDPERRPPLCPPLGMTWPFIKPSLAKASWKLWATVGHSDSSQAAHCLCPCPGRRQHREVQTGSAEVGQLWSWPWQVGRQPASHASAGKPGSCWSGEHCGPALLRSHLWLPSFFHGEASTQGRPEAGEEGPAIPQVTLGELLKCPRADSAVDRGSASGGHGRLYQSTSHQVSRPTRAVSPLSASFSIHVNSLPVANQTTRPS